MSDEKASIIGRCPNCTYIEEEAFDYDTGGNEVFRCGACGIVFVQPEGGAAIVIDAEGAYSVPIEGYDEFSVIPESDASEQPTPDASRDVGSDGAVLRVIR